MSENDRLAVEIIKMFEGLGLDDAYIKKSNLELMGSDRLGVLNWCSNLDDKYIVELCERLGESVEDFKITLETLKRL
jgi:hypothetical protein